MTLRILSLFAGIGGFDLGFASAGMTTVRFVEIDPFCQKVLRKHWPDVPITGDITAAEFTKGEADVICGGFPCQDISNAGKRAGITGERSGLWREYVRAVRLVRPLYWVVENVAALLGRGMGRVLGDMAESGYDAEWDCIPASAVGAPHLRDRLFVIAYFNEKRCLERGIRPFRNCGKAQPFNSISVEASISSNARQKRVQRVFPQEISRQSGFSWCENVRGVEDFFNRPDIPPPLFRGTCDGIPNWAHRIGALGNAVVPQISELLGRAIVADYESIQRGQISCPKSA